MQLNRAGLADKSAWEAKGYALPSFDYETVQKNTKENPFWVHFGVGNIFRAFQCNVVQNLLNAGVLDRGLRDHRENEPSTRRFKHSRYFKSKRNR